jgi:hypothetical protein
VGQYPFLYLYHGKLDSDLVDKVGWVAIGFQEPVGVEDRKRIMKSCPEPFAGFFGWSDTLFMSESQGDIFDSAIAEKHGAGREGLRRFAREVEVWVTEIHERNPIVFFVGPSPVLGGDPWDTWSWEAVPHVVLPYLEKYAQTHPESLVEVEEDEGEEHGEDDSDDEDSGFFTPGPVDLAQMQCLLEHFDVDPLGGEAEDRRLRAKALLERYGMNDG